MAFEVSKNAVAVVWVSNQSTGYCPEPESWPAVTAALANIGITAPSGFAPSCRFRRCPMCNSITLVKDGVLECGICMANLPANYNVQ